MRSIKLFSIPVIALALLVMPGCEKIKDFGNTNVNPNGATAPTTAALLTNVLSGIGARASQQNPGYYCQYFSETQYPTVSLYSNPQFDFDGIYAGPLYDLQNLILHCQNPETIVLASLNGNTKNQVAIARVLKCYYFWTITDGWGDIPYSEALTANPFTLTFSTKFPKYDSQEDVYKGLIAELTDVVETFEDGGDAVKGDIVYNGDVTKWRRFANSLRALMALRLSKKYPNPGDYASQQFKLAVKHPAGIIDDNAFNFKLVYPGGSFKNPWFGAYETRNDLGESLQFVNLLNGLNDPRQSGGFFGSSDNGVPYGRDRATFMNAWFSANSTTYSKVLGADYRAATSPVNIVHAAEILFAKSEARQRRWIVDADEPLSPLSAQQLYNKAIEASFDQWGVPSTALTTYLTVAGAVSLDNIAKQRYIALYPNGFQGWCEWRRTGVPQLTPAQNAINVTKQIPRRYVYGVNDYTTNRLQVTAAAALIPAPGPVVIGAIAGAAGDTQDGRVWWDR